MQLIINDDYYISPLLITDAPTLAHKIADFNVLQNLPDLPKSYNTKNALSFINKNLCYYAQHNKHINFAIKNSVHELCGGIGVQYEIENNNTFTAIIGYWLEFQLWNQSIMSKAIIIFSNYLINSQSVTKIKAKVLKHNIGSSKVLEKSGFILDAQIQKDLNQSKNNHPYKIYYKLK